MEELLHQKSKLNTVYSTILVANDDETYALFQDFAKVVRNFNYWKKSSPTKSSISGGAETAQPSSFLSEQGVRIGALKAVDAKTRPSKASISAKWLWDQCGGSHSSLQVSAHLMGNALPLAVHEICIKYRNKEAELQAALFELIGTDHMELLHVLVQNASGIATCIQREDLQRLLGAENSNTANTTRKVQGNNQQQHAQKLREEALEALNIAAIAKAEAESATIKSTATISGGSSITHSVTRASEKLLLKEAKRAAKIASAAVARANEAGITVGEEHLLSSLDISSLRDEADNFQKTKGLAGMTEESLQLMKANLLPEGSKQYYESRGLPLETKREYGDGYEKVVIPPRTLDKSKRHPRVKISDVMSTVESMAFAGTEYLNPMQSVVFESAFLSQENLLICAPTGAGKTNVAMLTIVAHFRDKGILGNKINSVHHNSGFEQGKKVIYIAPMKALAQEVVEKFDSKLRSLRIIVRELTGDMQLSKAEVASSDIIVTTPEKFDVVTRKSGDGSLCQTIGLVIIDEVHLLADDRGAVIESIVARLHRLVEATQRQMRIVGLSATLPNYRDVAQFLRVSERGLFHFGPEHRPVPLEQTFIGVSAKGRNAQERKMNEICYEIVSDSLRRGHQVMVFVHSRKGTGETATALADIAAKKGELESLFLTAGTESHGAAYTRYSERAANSRNRELSLHFNNGMSIHHAGMLRNDRKLSEQMFADGAIKVLCCTATLAWGINLPAHTVVIKGTEIYNPEKGGNVDLSILDVQQIFGRAGRPQFDTFGEAALLTLHDSLSRYINLLVSNVPIESNFIKQLPEHLNAEVVAGTASNIREAVEWLKYTYLYVRMLRNPLIYGISHDQKEDDPLLTGRCQELVKTAAKRLDELHMLRFDDKSGNLARTELGATASHFYIRTDSVATFNEKLEHMTSPDDGDLCHLVCCASEFDNIKVRQEEMDEIDTLNKACFLKVNIPTDEFSGKCCVLLQNFISNAKISSFTLISDTNYIAQNAARIARAMFEMALKRGKSSTALKLLRLAKSIDRRMWWSQSPLRQFHGEIPENVLKRIESKIKNGYDSMLSLLELDYSTNEFGEICGNKKVGGKIKKLIRMLPGFNVTCSVHPITSSILNFCIQLFPNFEWHQRWHGGALGFWFWIEDSEMDRVYHNEYVLISRRNHSLPVSLEVKVPVFQPVPSQYHIRIVSDSWVGCETLTPIFFKHLLLPDREMPFTNLLNLTPLPVGALKDSKYEKIYEPRFEAFNPLQSQLFHIMYHTNSNILLGAPTGSGKTLIAELALMRLKRIKPKAKCVYIAPLKSLARERLKEWSSRFGPSSVNWKVLELSGDTHHDTRALNEADVLICTPEKWDLITRGWRGVGLRLMNSPTVSSKLFIKSVGLLVIDEIHLLGEERGAVLESIVSRTRLISRNVLEEGRSSNTKSTPSTSSPASEQDVTRIIGLSTALANPKDLADWMGINVDEGSKAWKGLYNFRPSVRPIPMDVHLQGYPGRHYCPRMATMNKPAYSAIKEHSPDQPVLIFVSSRRQTRLTALDLISFAAADGNPSVFLGCDHSYIETVAETVIDATLKHTLLYGIAIHHAGLGSSDREIVESLFLDGSIQILVATATLAWGVNLPAHLVIVKGTEYFEKNRFVDYPLTDVLQMIGRAGRPGYSKQGVSVVMVAAEKKPFYKRFLYSPFPVESCLKKRMEVVLNAEIASATICSLSDAVGYLSWTYFFRRVKKNPSYYDAPLEAEDDNFQSYFIGIMREALNNLEYYSCIKVNRENDDWVLTSTVLGCTSSLFYLDYRTPIQMRSSMKDIICSLTDPSTFTGTIEQNSSAFTDTFLLVNRIIMALCFTHEFDEFPVRHNEEEMNDRLAASLELDVTVKRLLYERFMAEKDDADSFDIMADPHVKCYLLVIAYILRSPLPMSDYVNDTKSLLDQLPRLIGALQFILLNDTNTKWSFSLLGMLSKVKQVLNSRTIDMDPLLQIPFVSKESADSLRMHGLNFFHLCMKGSPPVLENALREVIPRATELGRAVSYIQSLVLITIDETSIVKSADKNADGNHEGVCNVVLSMMAIGGKKKKTKANITDINIMVCLGLPDIGKVLAIRSVCLSISNDNTVRKTMRKEITLTFDWENAVAGADTEGNITLSMIREDIKGLDITQALRIVGK